MASDSSPARHRRPSFKSLKRLVSSASLRGHQPAPPAVDARPPPVPAIPAVPSAQDRAPSGAGTLKGQPGQAQVYGTAQLAKSTASPASWGAHLSSSQEDMRLTIPSPTRPGRDRSTGLSSNASSSSDGSTLSPTTPKTPTSKGPLRLHLPRGPARGSDPPKRKASRLAEKYGSPGKADVGEGATAVIKTAHRPDGSRDMVFAVKEFRKRKAGEREKDYMKKMTAEFCISSTMRHENVVRMLDLIQDERGRWCGVMEYLSGGDLFSRIKSGLLFPAEADSYFRQLVEGVAYIHSMGVAHRDVKPENLVLDGKGGIKIADFGVSDVFRTGFEETVHRSRGLCGSDPYLPPEVFAEEDYDARLVDVWSSVIVYYCCVAGALPWPIAKPSDPSFLAYLEDHALGKASPAPLGTLGREARPVVGRMLDPAPAKRPLMDDVLRDPWVRAIRRVDNL